MRFQFSDKNYSIEFRRNHQTLIDRRTGEEFLSTYPATTVLIMQVVEGKKVGDWPVIAQATVGCLDTDRFSLESGRLAALKRLSGEVKVDLNGNKKCYPCQVPEKMVVPMWAAYHSRKPKKVDLRAEVEQLRSENAELKRKIQEISEGTERGES